MTIKFLKPSFSEFEANPKQTLMRNLQDKKIPVASSCGGEGICGKCKVNVLAGSENISPPAELEESLKSRMKIEKSYRLSCQCFISGDIVIDASYW